MTTYKDTELSSYALKSFTDGYNSYANSKTFVKDTEIPQGAVNVVLDGNGSVTKFNGKARYGGQIVSGHAVMGIGWLRNSTHNKIISACNTGWYYDNGITNTLLTGATFSADKKTQFAQAFDKLYGANDNDNLAYTADGSTITSISSNGNVGNWPTFFNQRLYMTNATFKDRIYYSNPYALDLSTSPPTLTGFSDANMFNTDLTASPKKNAGYIVLSPGSGIEITCLYKDNTAGVDYLYAGTKSHGLWRIGGVATANSDGSIAHTVIQIVPGATVPSGRSVGKAGNDTWFFDGFNFNTYGEAATFQNARVTPKGGRVKGEATSIPSAGRDDVAFAYFDSKVYYAYQTGTYNDHVIVFDTILNAWSAPRDSWNVSCFLVFEESDGTRRLLAGSSNPSDSYIYQLDTGTDDQGVAISSMFQTKSTDCGKPGLVKYFAFAKVFYGMVFGTLTYEVFIDEVSSITGTLQLGNSTNKPVGFGSRPFGSFLFGDEYDTSTTFASLAQNNYFTIDCEYNSGTKIAIQFSNAVTGEQFKINMVKFYFDPGSEYESLI